MVKIPDNIFIGIVLGGVLLIASYYFFLYVNHLLVQYDRFLAQSAARNPQKTALICGARRTSYAEIDGSANALARALLALGVERQDRIAIQYENSVETAIAIYATLRAAGVFMVVNPQVKPDKLAFILSDAKAKVLLTSARNASAVCAALTA